MFNGLNFNITTTANFSHQFNEATTTNQRRRKKNLKNNPRIHNLIIIIKCIYFYSFFFIWACIGSFSRYCGYEQQIYRAKPNSFWYYLFDHFFFIIYTCIRQTDWNFISDFCLLSDLQVLISSTFWSSEHSIASI